MGDRDAIDRLDLRPRHLWNHGARADHVSDAGLRGDEVGPTIERNQTELRTKALIEALQEQNHGEDAGHTDTRQR